MNVHRSRLGEDLGVEKTAFEDFEAMARLQARPHRRVAAAAVFKPTIAQIS